MTSPIVAEPVDLYFGLKWIAFRGSLLATVSTGLGRTEAEAIADLRAQEACVHDWAPVEPGIEQCRACPTCRIVDDAAATERQRGA